MNKEAELRDKESLTQHAISLEKHPNRKAKLQNDLKIIRLRLQIEDFKERIKNLQNNN